MPVTLTFDNGPAAGVTDRVLDVLGELDVKATFFVVGSMLERAGGRDLAERASAEGHWIGNHSMRHATPLGSGPDRVETEREINDAQALLAGIGHERRFFRPFGGGGVIGPHLLNRRAVEVLCEGRYTCVLWNCVPRDWEDPAWPQVALDEIEALDHAVVVLHDLPTGAMEALPSFLAEVSDRGHDIVQDFPDEVIAIDRGSIRELDGLVCE